MRVSQFPFVTYKEVPADAEVASHQLMLRAGLIRKLGAGLYTWMPMGLRVLRKVEAVVRAEMDAIGAYETLMPAVQPAELWQETGRWDQYGSLLLQIQDRQGRSFCFGPTHEEVVTDIVRNMVRSYKQLPLALYQIQTKFRDEIRPRFGMMRAREFMMKDAYSFDLDDAGMAASYQKMVGAYHQIFTRLGLSFRAVQADSGEIGGAVSQEFQVLAATGEDVIAYCEHSDYAANIEEASALAPDLATRPAAQAELTKVATPGLRRIDAVAQHLVCTAQQMVKTLLVKGEEAPMVALILRGDHRLNTIKAEKLDAVATPLTLLDEAAVQAALGCEVGSLGPVGLTCPVYVDPEAAVLADFVCGANQTDQHYTGVNWGRDCPEPEVIDLREVIAGDPSPDGQGPLALTRGIEVGHVFQLGDKYSQAMQATVLNEQGKAVPLQMGCYGIGVSRVVAAAIEQHHDERGICWPLPLAPFQVVILPMNQHKSYRVADTCAHLYRTLSAQGIEVLWDDRKERPGVLFADAELLGIPWQIIVGERHLDKEEVELKSRKATEGEARLLPIKAVIAEVLHCCARHTIL